MCSCRSSMPSVQIYCPRVYQCSLGLPVPSSLPFYPSVWRRSRFSSSHLVPVTLSCDIYMFSLFHLMHAFSAGLLSVAQITSETRCFTFSSRLAPMILASPIRPVSTGGLDIGWVLSSLIYMDKLLPQLGLVKREQATSQAY
jgi:hypothetical protein